MMGVPPLSPDTIKIVSPLTGVLDFQPRTGNFRYYNAQGTNLGGKDLAKFLAPRGTNLADPHVQDVFNAIYSIIIQTSKNIGTNNPLPLLDRSSQSDRHSAAAVHSWAVYDEPNPILIAVLALFWLIIWIYGFRRILR